MAVDQAPGKDEKAKPAVTGFVRSVIQRGMNIDWNKVGAVGTVIGGISVLHGLRHRRWRYIHTLGILLAIAAAVAPRLMEKFAGAERAPEGE
jgi:hypothetical protein